MVESWEGGLEEFPGRSGVSLRTGVPGGSGNQAYAPPSPTFLCSQESECADWSPRSWRVSGGSTWTVCAGRSLESCSRNFGVGDSKRRWPAALVHPKQKEGVLGTCRASFQPSPSVQRHPDPRIIYSAHRVALPTHGSLTYLGSDGSQHFFPHLQPSHPPQSISPGPAPCCPLLFLPHP